MGAREFETPYMTIAEVAEFLHVHYQTVYGLMREEGLPGFKIGSHWRFHRGAVEGWMEKRSVGAGAK